MADTQLKWFLFVISEASNQLSELLVFRSGLVMKFTCSAIGVNAVDR